MTDRHPSVVEEWPSAPSVEVLLEKALAEQWDFYADLPWHLEVDPERVGMPAKSFFAHRLPQFAKMRRAQQRELAFREACYHLSNLLAGERSGEHLGAQILLLTGEERPGDREFLALLIHEEAKHFLALQRYLSRKVCTLYQPSKRLNAVLSAVQEHPDPALKLLVGQVILEGTAASLVASLLIRAKDKLLGEILRHNLRDESRHIAYSYTLITALSEAFKRSEKLAELEDIVYESAVSMVHSLLAIPVWREAGLAMEATRQCAVERLRELGVLQRYTRFIPAQLARCGFPTEKLIRRLEQGLASSLLRSNDD